MSNTNLLVGLSDNIKIDQDKCIYCGTCVDTCILDNLRMKLAPCRNACPLGLNAQGYVKSIARGQEDLARTEILKSLPFPEILGRVCNAPCEENCYLVQESGQGVGIRALKRYLFDSKPVTLTELDEPKDLSGKSCAIVGSGPSGLLAAYDLVMAGHAVTVYDSAEQAGGLLRYAIPEFRLPTDVLERALTLLEELGVSFEMQKQIGQDLSLEDLKAEFDAVILAVGLGKGLELKVQGEDLVNVHSGLELLQAAKTGSVESLEGEIVVIGGGNVAMDAAQTALRLGGEKVTVVSLEQEDEMPAFDHEVVQCQAEGVEFVCGFGVNAITGENGKATGLDLKACASVFDEDGKFNPSFDTQDTTQLKAEHVIVAIGQKNDALAFCQSLKSDVTPLTLQTKDEKIFIAGDCEHGASSAVEAMASGRKAAKSVDLLFNDEPINFNRSYAGAVVTDFEIKGHQGSGEPRVKCDHHEFTGKGDFAEPELTFTQDQAQKEAKRCNSCGTPFGKHRTCWFCLPCEVECPQDALWVDVPYLLR